MTKKSLKQMQAGLTGQHEGIPETLMKLFGDLLPVIPSLVGRFVPKGQQIHNFEDCEAEAICVGYKYVTDTVKAKPISLSWPKARWEYMIKSAFKNGIIDSIQHILYPLVIPRPLMFSVKKYIDAMEIIEQYVRGENLEYSDIYRIAFHTDCRIIPCFNQDSCILNRKECAFARMEDSDRTTLHALIKGHRRSLSFYAKGYRKTLAEWVELIKQYKFMAVNQITEYEQPDYVDLDKTVTLSRLKDELDQLHPDMFDIYCMALSDTDINNLIDTATFEFPKGWLAHQIRTRHGLNADSLATLLNRGDKIINEFRKQHGFPPLQRVVSQQPAEREAV